MSVFTDAKFGVGDVVKCIHITPPVTVTRISQAGNDLFHYDLEWYDGYHVSRIAESSLSHIEG